MRFDPAKVATIIVNWYAENRRELPWRKNQDPYRIWISEIMLQQTRVETVIPYFERFLKRYPTITDLANAPDDELTGLWAGLGYYSRARNLKKAAQAMVANFSGKMPRTIPELLSLPGIGPYTASAIASIAFGEPVAAVDGNLERVIARLLALKEEAKSSSRLREVASEMAAKSDASALNQGFMDFANKVCRAKNPDCLICPLNKFCAAYAEGDTESYPVKAKKKEKVEIRARGFALLRLNAKVNEVLLARRPEKSWLAGMWDLPWWIDEAGEAPLEIPGEDLGTAQVTRTITHHKVRFSIQGQRLVGHNQEDAAKKKLRAAGAEFRWLSLEQAMQEIPKPSRKIIEKLYLDAPKDEAK